MEPLVVGNVAYHENNKVHRINNREWTDEQGQRFVKIKTKERTREKHFMKRVKERCGTKFPTVAREQHKSLSVVQGDLKEKDEEDLQWRMMRWLQLKYLS